MFKGDILRDAATFARTTPAILRSPCRHATSVRKRRKVARFLHQQGLSIVRIARLLGRNESTVKRYINPAYAARRDAKMRQKYQARRRALAVDKQLKRSKVEIFETPQVN